MNRSKRGCALALVLALFLVASCSQGPVDTAAPGSDTGDRVLDAAAKQTAEAIVPIEPEVFATGLINPRGLEWGPDGYLYVAEGGTGGTNSTVGQCQQVPPPIGPYTGSSTGGRISRISPEGVRTTLVDDLPSSETSPSSGSLISGVADVAFIGDQLYAILAGAGCSHGVPELPNGVVAVDPDGSWSMIANLSEWQQTHPVANPEEDDFEPDGTWYSMIAVRGMLYAVEPNHGEMVQITPEGQISRVIDISAGEGHIVPTAVAYRGSFFVGNLDTFPIVEGSSKILRIAPNGSYTVWATDLTTVVGVEIDGRGRLYVLENTTDNPEPTPGTGKVIRIDHSGRKETLVTGLDVPTAMTFGPDGMLYISNVGFGAPPVGLGEVLRVDLAD